MPRSLITLIAVLAAACLAPTALAAPALNGTFPISGKPKYLTAGPDGNVWFTMSDSTKEFGRITPTGTVTEFDSPNAMNSSTGITAGPNNTVWITETNAVVRVPTANPAAGQSFPVADLADPRGISSGPDGNIWAASGDTVFKINPANGTVIDTKDVPGMMARGVSRGGGTLWVADSTGRIVKVTTGLVATPYTVGGMPQEVVGGPNQVGFTIPSDEFGRMGYNGPPVLPTAMPMTDPFGVTLGADGAYWIAQFASSTVGRVTARGAYTQLPMPAGSGPRYIAAGPANTIWVGLETAKRIARITGVESPPTGGGGGGADTTAPVVTKLRVRPKVVRVRGPKRRRGARIRFNSSERGRATVRIQRARLGRRAGGKCVKPTSAPAGARKCTRWVRVGTLRRAAKAGKNSIKFSGRIRRKPLRPGRHRVVATIRDAAGNRSAPRRAKFRVAKQRRRARR